MNDMPERVVVVLDTTPEHGEWCGKLAVLNPATETCKHAALVREEEEGCCILADYVLASRLEAQERRVARLEAALKEIAARSQCVNCEPGACAYDIARTALEPLDEDKP